MMNLSVTTNTDSPRAWQQYVLLHSPKAGLLSRSVLPFIILSIGTGVLLSATRNKMGLRMAPSCATHKSVSLSTQMIEGGAADAYLGGNTANVSFPIAWLMSFPNSGTSYTSHLLRSVTGLRTASNYGTENLGEDGTSVKVFNDSPGGPFWTQPLNPNYTMPQAGSKGFLLTKTHCGGRCNQCPPEKYIEDHSIFSRRCFEGYHVEKDGTGEPREVLGSYSKDIVHRAVHLIRDPFDNIVSRFHLDYKHFVKRNRTEKLAAYPRSRKGFRAFCKGLGESFHQEEEAARFFREVLDDDVKKLPCHADFYKYVQWHNLAFATTWDLRIPTMILHYENYTSNFNQTKDELLEFLDLDQNEVREPPLFITGKTYREYFTAKEVRAVSKMFSKLALDTTLTYTRHYFD